MSTREQEVVVRLLDTDAELAAQVEEVTGRPLEGMSFGEKLFSYQEWLRGLELRREMARALERNLKAMARRATES